MSELAALVNRLSESTLVREEGGPLSRRRLLMGLGGALLGALTAKPARAGPPASQTQWLVDRITFGRTEAEVALANSFATAEDYLEYHLNPAAIDDSAMDARLVPYTTLFMQPYELIALQGGQVRNELIEAAILRAVFSKRQLFERMVEFWGDHFNIDINNGLDQQYKTIDDRDVIRANALGTFPALLAASAHSPAMLYYLDNITSTAGNPNENYARELLELHSMGVTGGYTQQDVQEVARCFTGWQVWGANANPQEIRWTFRYNNNQHDNGAKTVLGQAIPANGGQNDGNLVLNILANHASTREFIARKLCIRFWGDNPPQSLVDAVATTYQSTGGDIKAMLRTLFLSHDWTTAPQKYKRPFHNFMSFMRASGATITTTSALRTQLTGAGQLPFSWSPPDGYPETLEAWVGLILPRWNFGALVMNGTNGSVSGVNVDISVLLAGMTTAQQVADRIEQALFRGAMDPAEKNLILNYLLPNNPSTTKKREAVGLAMAMPSFQWI